MPTGQYEREKIDCSICGRSIAHNQMPKHQRTHSEPKRRYKTKPTTIKKMNHLEIGWVAGILEGEGSFHSKENFLQVRCTMTDLDTINKLREVTGIGTFSTWHRNGKEPNRKDAYNWTVSKRNDIIHLLCSIVPLMGERRRTQIDKLLTNGGF